MFLRRDNEATCKGRTVGIYEESDPCKTLYRTSPEEATKLVSNLNQQDNPEAYICEKCGCLLIVLQYVEKSKRFLQVNSNLWQASWEEGRIVEWDYLCDHCKAGVPQEQLAEMGVIEL